jgi:hypothetical protein
MLDDNVMGIAIETRMPIELIHERLCATANKYQVSVDDLSSTLGQAAVLRKYR